MTLIDTSVWIRYLAGNSPYASKLDSLLDGDEVAGHDLVMGELLVGDLGGRAKFLSTYELLWYAEVVSHREVVQFVRERRLHGLGLGWIDVHLLASAVVGHLGFWTADRRLGEVSKQFGLSD